MKKEYKKPVITIDVLDEKDIIITSLTMGPDEAKDNIIDFSFDPIEF